MKRISKISRILLVLLFLLLLPAFAFSCEKKDEPEPEPTYASLTFMTYNVRYNGDNGALAALRRLPRIINRIALHSPDVFGAQEAQPYHIKKLTEAFSDTYTAVYCYRNLNCTPCQGHFYLFVLGNVCLSTLQLTIPSNG